jgi:hypothetical protein
MVAKYPDDKILIDKIDKYFDLCDLGRVKLDKDGNEIVKIKPYTISGLCLYLDITRETLNEYSKTKEHSDTIKKARLRVESWLEERALTNEVNTISAIFNLKNNFGWKDKTEVEAAVNIEITLSPDLKDLIN